MMTFRNTLIMIMIMSAAHGAWADQNEDIKRDMPFKKARARLFKMGWHPVNLHHGKDHEFIGTEKLLEKARIFEFESCAIDRALCIMNYKRGKRCLKVIVRGETLQAMRVDSWDSECPVLSP
jgi:hypothetical protein